MSSTGRPRGGGKRLLGLIIGGGMATSAVLFFTLVRSLPAPSHRLPFLPLVALFAVAEMAVVNVEVGSQTHTWSLVEVPLILGLLTVEPKQMVAAWLLGGAVTLAAVRRQSLSRLAYNLTAFALEAVSALLLYHWVAGGPDILRPRTSAGILVATLAASTISILSVFTAVSVTEGSQPRDERLRYLVFGLVSTGVTTSTILIGIVLERTDPASLWLLAVPVVGIYLAQRAFTGHVRDHRRLQFLRNSTELVAGLGSDESVISLLRQICQTLNTDAAALAYLPVDLQDSMAVAVCGPDAEERIELVPRSELWDTWGGVAGGRRARIVDGPNGIPPLERLIGLSGMRQAMVVPLRGDLRVIGYLTVADLQGSTPFSSEDMQVLDTLERFVSMGLENGHLERSLQDARLLERQLVHRATHDSLTGLANRTLLADHLSRLLAEPGEADIACLFIDLDNFKSVNDRFGHPTGDQLLVVTAQRLVGCLRDGDLAARLGGDELAVVAHVDPGNADREAAILGQRILAALARPASIGEHTVSTAASIGVVIRGGEDSASDLLAAADAAMYAAKAAGKGRVEILGTDLETGRTSH